MKPVSDVARRAQIVERGRSVDGLLQRYRPVDVDDGLVGVERVFTCCSFRLELDPGPVATSGPSGER